jgi:hypothetical protein
VKYLLSPLSHAPICAQGVFRDRKSAFRTGICLFENPLVFLSAKMDAALYLLVGLFNGQTAVAARERANVSSGTPPAGRETWSNQRRPGGKERMMRPSLVLAAFGVI